MELSCDSLILVEIVGGTKVLRNKEALLPASSEDAEKKSVTRNKQIIDLISFMKTYRVNIRVTLTGFNWQRLKRSRCHRKSLQPLIQEQLRCN